MSVHVTVWDEAGTGAPSVVLVHGTMTWGAACFERQRSLAAGYRLLVVDRRGYGASPDIDHSDYDVDAADVVGRAWRLPSIECVKPWRAHRRSLPLSNTSGSRPKRWAPRCRN